MRLSSLIHTRRWLPGVILLSATILVISGCDSPEDKNLTGGLVAERSLLDSGCSFEYAGDQENKSPSALTRFWQELTNSSSGKVQQAAKNQPAGPTTDVRFEARNVALICKDSEPYNFADSSSLAQYLEGRIKALSDFNQESKKATEGKADIPEEVRVQMNAKLEASQKAVAEYETRLEVWQTVSQEDFQRVKEEKQSWLADVYQRAKDKLALAKASPEPQKPATEESSSQETAESKSESAPGTASAPETVPGTVTGTTSAPATGPGVAVAPQAQQQQKQQQQQSQQQVTQLPLMPTTPTAQPQPITRPEPRPPEPNTSAGTRVPSSSPAPSSLAPVPFGLVSPAPGIPVMSGDASTSSTTGQGTGGGAKIGPGNNATGTNLPTAQQLRGEPAFSQSYQQLLEKYSDPQAVKKMAADSQKKLQTIEDKLRRQHGCQISSAELKCPAAKSPDAAQTLRHDLNSYMVEIQNLRLANRTVQVVPPVEAEALFIKKYKAYEASVGVNK